MKKVSKRYMSWFLWEYLDILNVNRYVVEIAQGKNSLLTVCLYYKKPLGVAHFAHLRISKKKRVLVLSAVGWGVSKREIRKVYSPQEAAHIAQEYVDRIN